ncbi:hypothetical protein MMPV_004673, partial [Pyropia vietnamensis]
AMAPLCASRLAVAAVIAAVVVAAVAVAAGTPSAAVAAPRVPIDGRSANRQFVSDPSHAVEEVGVFHDHGSLKCLPSLAPMCNLETHMELDSVRKCLPPGYSAEAVAARSEFARIESMVAAALPVSITSCCYAKATIEDIRRALVRLAPTIHCSKDQSPPLSALPGDGSDVLPGGPVTTWGSVVIPGDDSLWCCDSQNYAPEDPANRPCCVDGCYDIVDALGWLGYTIDNCCALSSNRKQYGRVCPPGTINLVRV